MARSRGGEARSVLIGRQLSREGRDPGGSGNGRLLTCQAGTVRCAASSRAVHGVVRAEDAEQGANVCVCGVVAFKIQGIR